MKEKNDFTDEKKYKHLNNEVKKFLNRHRDVEISAAKLEYSLFYTAKRVKKQWN